MLLTHYMDLLRRYRRPVVLMVLGTGAAAALISMVLLVAMPVYRAEARVTILPTQAELVFTKQFLQGSTINPADLMIQTHIEYLLSRPVAELTLEKLTAELPEEVPAPQGLLAGIGQRLGEALHALRVAYDTLNAGQHVEPTPYDAAIADIQKSVGMRMVEGSFILEIAAASSASPQAAALIANTLAEAYVERNREVVGATAAALTQYLQGEIARRQQELDNIFAAEMKIRDELGVVDPTTEREAVTRRLNGERAAMEADSVALAGIDARIAKLKRDGDAFMRQGRLADLQARMQDALQDKAGVEARLQSRAEVVADLERKLRRLADRELSLSLLEGQSAQIKEEMANLRNRLVDVELSRASAIGQVRIIDPAVAPVYPSFPKVVPNTFAGLVAGGFAAALMLILVDTFSHTAKTSADMVRLVGERFLGRVPRQIAVLAAGPGKKARLPTARVAGFAAAAAERIALLGPANHAWASVVAMGDLLLARQGALAVAAAYAWAGSPVVVDFGGGDRLRVGRRGDTLNLDPLTPDEDRSPDMMVTISSLRPGASAVAAREGGQGRYPANMKPLLVFVVKAGQTSEEVLGSLSGGAEPGGGQPLFLLVA